jgi:hypothetical protein
LHLYRPSPPVRIEDNLIAGNDVVTFLMGPPSRDVAVQLKRNTLVGRTCWTFTILPEGDSLAETADAPGQLVRFESVGNVLASDVPFKVLFTYPEEVKANQWQSLVQRFIHWHEEQDIVPARTAASIVKAPVAGKDPSELRIRSVANWTRSLGLPETAVSEGTFTFQCGDLTSRAITAPEQLTTEDFRLRADSAGYRALQGGNDLGADVDLVGPGPAYERWKKTPEYQQWLKEIEEMK